MKLVPEAIFEQHSILLGKTRSGKSSVMRLLVEHLLDKEKPVTIVDPKGDWWGLKASADGKKAGYPLVIFGGEHADVPLNVRSGAAVAELLATGNRSAIIDLGGWMPGDRTQFWIDFASTYFRTHRGRHYLVLDEVHNLCPKGKIMDPNAGKMLHWSNRLASEGLGKGISMIAASQRPQKVHNDFLTSCETLFAMRVIHAADRGALADWIDGCGDDKQGKELIETIAQMKRGEAWVWSPEAEFGPKCIQFPMFKTFDSFKAQGAHQVKLSGWAEVDLEDVRKKLESAVKEAEAKDPTKLRQRIAQLEAELKKKHPQVEAKSVADPRAIDRAVAAERQQWERQSKIQTEAIAKHIKSLAAKLDTARDALQRVVKAMPSAEDCHLPGTWGAFKREEHPAFRPTPIPTPKTHRYVKVTGTAESNGSEPLPKGERAVMIAVAQYEEGVGRDTLTVLTGYKRSTRDAYIQRLKERGFVEFNGRGEVRPTQDGVNALGSDYEPLPVGSALREHWLRKLPEGERKVLDYILQHGQDAVERDPITEATGYKRSTRDAYLQRLVARRLVEITGRNEVKASDTLFD